MVEVNLVIGGKKNNFVNNLKILLTPTIGCATI